MHPLRPSLIALLCLMVLEPLSAAAPDPVDSPAVSRALNSLLETAKTGTRSRWDGSAGRYGFITINRTYYPQPDSPCRDYVRTIHNPGKDPTRLRGTGCRDDNGLWLILETYTPNTAASPAKACKPVPKTQCPPVKKSSRVKRRRKSVPAVPAPVPKPDPAQAVAAAANRPTAAEW